jgi:hypothetical protein
MGLQDHSAKSRLEELGIEVDEKSDAASGEAKICQKLSPMNREQLFHGFCLNNNARLDKEIEAITGVNPNALVHDRQGDLTFEDDLSLRQFVSKTVFVR